MLMNQSERYGAGLICLHWGMLLLLAAVYASIELREVFPKGSDARDALKFWHFMLGLGVFGMVWVRLAFRLAGTIPAIAPELPSWEILPAKIAHGALYALMIVIPLAGWLALSAAGKPIVFFGLSIPALIEENKPISKLLEEIHEFGGKAGYFLIGFHTLAVAYHQWIRRDNLLARMLPRRV